MRIFNRLVAWIYSLASLYISGLLILVWLDKEFAAHFFKQLEATEPYKFALAGGVLILIGSVWLVSVIEYHYLTRSVSFTAPGGLVRVRLSAVEDFLMNEIRQRIKAVKRIKTSTILVPKGLRVFNRVIIWSGYDIPDITGKIQDLIRKLLQDTIGVERILDVKVYVSHISPTEGTGTPQEEDESEDFTQDSEIN
ncbi:MAG: hypothetical protein V2A65_03025 [Candidatus Omnitrophota bacterium]